MSQASILITHTPNLVLSEEIITVMGLNFDQQLIEENLTANNCDFLSTIASLISN